MKKNIGLLRGVFDPIHEGHYANLTASISGMQLNILNIIVKIIGEKDPIASLQQRKEMMQLQIGNIKNVKIITQNIRGHIAHLLEIGELYKNDNLVQICGSDKINREMKVYGKSGDIFGVVKRKEFNLNKESFNIVKQLGITLKQIIPETSTSSTFIRGELLKNREKKPIGLNNQVYNYILENDLYIHNLWDLKEYIKQWNGFIEFLKTDFYELNLDQLNIPIFNNLQHKNGWKEKFIREVIKQKGLKGSELEEFVKKSLKYNY